MEGDVLTLKVRRKGKTDAFCVKEEHDKCRCLFGIMGVESKAQVGVTTAEKHGSFLQVVRDDNARLNF